MYTYWIFVFFQISIHKVQVHLRWSCGFYWPARSRMGRSRWRRGGCRHGGLRGLQLTAGHSCQAVVRSYAPRPAAMMTGTFIQRRSLMQTSCATSRPGDCLAWRVVGVSVR